MSKKLTVSKKQGAELKAWAAALAESKGTDEKTELEELKGELRTIIDKPMLQDFSDKEKVEHAIRILKAQRTTPLVQKGRDFEVLVLDFTEAKKITPRDKSKEPFMRAEVVGIAICTDEEATSKEKDLTYFDMPLFRDNTKLINNLDSGTTYKIKVNANHKDGIWIFNAIDNSTNFVKAKEQLEMDIEEFLTEQFHLVQIAEAEFNLSNLKKSGDLKLVRGNVTYSNTHKSESGYEYGRYVLIDDSLDIEDLKRNGGLSVMCDPSQVRWAEGSDLLILGEITKNDDRVGMSAKAIIPIIPIPRDMDDLDDDDDEDEFDDDDEEFIDEDELQDDDDDDEFEDEPEDTSDDEVDEEPEPEPKEKPKKKSTKKSTKKETKKKKKDDDDDDDIIEL